MEGEPDDEAEAVYEGVEDEAVQLVATVNGCGSNRLTPDQRFLVTA